MIKYKCIKRYSHNSHYVIPLGAIVNVSPDDNSFMIWIVYGDRHAKINYTTLRKYFTSYKEEN